MLRVDCSRFCRSDREEGCVKVAKGLLKKVASPVRNLSND